MELVITIISVGFSIGLSYLGLLSFGPKRTAILYSAAEKEEWDQSLNSGRLGGWLTSTSIVATLTSFATVMVFFIGNTSVFGYWILVCPLSLLIGIKVTNGLTSLVVASKQGDSGDSNWRIGVLPALFYSEGNRTQIAAQYVRWLQLLAVGAVVWLEFAILGDIGGRILGIEATWIKSLIVFITSAMVIGLVLNYGVRGVVFTDLFQAPLVGLAVVLLIVGGIIASRLGDYQFSIVESFRPLVPARVGFLFVGHVVLLNSALVVTSQAHWLRIWVFGERESRLQGRSVLGTAAFWSAMILFGALVASLMPGVSGDMLVERGVNTLGSLSVFFLFAFWMGGTAALFSTADTQIYSWLLLNAYDPQRNVIVENRNRYVRRGYVALGAGAAFAFVYYLTRSMNLPFSKLIFTIMPLASVTLPGLLWVARGWEGVSRVLAVTVVIYFALNIVGFVNSSDVLFWNLLAAGVPWVVVAIGVTGSMLGWWRADT